MIRFSNVSKQFRKGDTTVRALDNVTFEVEPGQLALVRGPSGSGKTTLINLAAGLSHASLGSIHVAGTCIDGLSLRERANLRAREVAVVFQLFHLVPYLTALENVLLPTLATPGAGNAPERARGLLAELGLESRGNHYPDEMSAGERQRCALARALLNEPAVILADEPTGNLDPASAETVLAHLDNARKRGATVLLVSHQPIDSIRPDVVFELREGRLLP
ncbi:MAG TPA: ABC transporter ATP-binding protein [Candidatus Hydrogenedentes bacterium]|nr:ABC transporter ATP-binding protein [Candidatus Hydrogenedentota bacterium]